MFFSGQLINLSPVGGNGQLHNYGLIFFFSSCGAFAAFLWAVFMINQRNDRNLFQEYFPETRPLMKQKLIEEENDLAQNCYDNTHPLRLLFDIKNVKEIVMTCLKKRDGYVRAEIWLIIGGMFCAYVLGSGPGVFFFQFAEKIYKWDAEIWTLVSSIGMMANSLVVILITPILIKVNITIFSSDITLLTIFAQVFKLNDVLLSLIGFCGVFAFLLIVGTVLSPMGYFIALIVHTTAPLGPIGYKTHLSKIVEPSELGKVFTLMAVIDGFAPIIAAAVFNLVFDKTIDSLPGLCFLILSAVAIIPIVVALTIDYLNVLNSVEQNNNLLKNSYPDKSFEKNERKTEKLYPEL